jgi:hypothetical protein
MAPLTEARLAHENATHRCTGGVSEESRSFGFRPAFMDSETLKVYPSRFADGRPAPFHALDGLPDDVVLARRAGGRVAAVKASVISGFLLGGRFYSREQAARFAASR